MKSSEKMLEQKQVELVLTEYFADKTILAFNFRILKAYEKWPFISTVGASGRILKRDDERLTQELGLIEVESKEYVSKTYPTLKAEEVDWMVKKPINFSLKNDGYNTFFPSSHLWLTNNKAQ